MEHHKTHQHTHTGKSIRKGERKGAERTFEERIVGGAIKMAEQEDIELTPPHTNISKIHPHVEQFSLKTNWKLAEIYMGVFIKDQLYICISC